MSTKLRVPSIRAALVDRPALIKLLDRGLKRKLVLVSAPAGFGKTTLISGWLGELKSRNIKTAWLSLDESDGEASRFLSYIVASLRTIEPALGEGLLATLQSPQAKPTDSMLAVLVNEIAEIECDLVLALDDYHQLDSPDADHITAFLIENAPPPLHLVIITREDPPLPLGRLRARDMLSELRASDLRFSPSETTEFLSRVMGLRLLPEEIAALEGRTEGWIAGLHLAALSLRGQGDAAEFIRSFTGSHRFILDYLVEEVLNRQSPSIVEFLLTTSVLDRLCGPLCDAVLDNSGLSGQSTLEYLERANLFLVPLDGERRWYRYHHLFSELLRKRFEEYSRIGAAAAKEAPRVNPAELHVRASGWYEENGLGVEAFRHAAAAGDIDRAERLIEEGDIPLHSRGAAKVILDWLETLPPEVINERPILSVRFASMSLVMGRTTGIEEKLEAAQQGLEAVSPDVKTRGLLGQIAATRATLALTRYQTQGMIVQARRALEYLRPEDLPFRLTAKWVLGAAYGFLGDRRAAASAIEEILELSRSRGNTFFTILATVGRGEALEMDTRLREAEETYRRALELIGDYPQPNACEPHLGIARIRYQWNDLEAAREHGMMSLELARQYDTVIDRHIVSELFLARLEIAEGDTSGAASRLDRIEQSSKRQNFIHRLPEIAAARSELLLARNRPEEAARVIADYDLPLSRARVILSSGNPSGALDILEPLRMDAEAKGWDDERLETLVLTAAALGKGDKTDRGLGVLGEIFELTEGEGFIRLFVDLGTPMKGLLQEAALREIHPRYTRRILSAFSAPVPAAPGSSADNGEAVLGVRLIVKGFDSKAIAVKPERAGTTASL